uniref:Uncharacterized protein n=1 Tax=Anolis carolinensis TaxID=28377 RepID=H9GHK6_ANOCA
MAIQFKSFQGRSFHHTLRQRVPMLNSLYSQKVLPNIQIEARKQSTACFLACFLAPFELFLNCFELFSSPDTKHGKNCPIDCASIYYNGIRRSGIYSIMPSAEGLPIEVLCEMDVEGAVTEETVLSVDTSKVMWPA